MAEETYEVTAFFELTDDVDKAVKRLHDAGVGRDQIIMEERHGGAEGVLTTPGKGGGLFGVLQDTVTPDAGQGPEGGAGHTGYLVTVHALAGQHDRVVEILGRDGSVETDERSSE